MEKREELQRDREAGEGEMKETDRDQDKDSTLHTSVILSLT